DNRRVDSLAADLLEDAEARFVGKQEVEDDRVELLRPGRDEAVLAVANPGAVVARLAEPLLHRLADVEIVLDDEHFHGGRLATKGRGMFRWERHVRLF